MSKFKLFIYHHMFKKAYSILVYPIFFIRYYLKSNDKIWKERKRQWDNVKSITDLSLFFQKNIDFKIRKDKWFSHDNSIYEYLAHQFHNNDSARMIWKKLKKLNYNVELLCFYNRDYNYPTYECLCYHNNNYIIFNLGDSYYGTSKNEVINKFNKCTGLNLGEYIKCYY